MIHQPKKVFNMSTYFGTVVQQQETRTMKGIRSMITALGIFMAAGLLGIISGALAISLLSGNLIDPGTGAINPEALSKAIGVIALACGLVILELVGIILAFVGFWTMYKGKAEYGSIHDKDIDRAVKLFIAGIVIFFVEIFVGAMVGIASALGGIANPSGMASATPIILVASAITSALLATVIALILYYLIKAFIPSDKHNTVLLAIGLYVAASIVSLVGALLIGPPADYYANPGAVPFDLAWIFPGLIGGLLGFIALMLFFILYRHVLERMRTRQVRPIWENPATMSVLQATELRWQPPPRT